MVSDTCQRLQMEIMCKTRYSRKWKGNAIHIFTLPGLYNYWLCLSSPGGQQNEKFPIPPGYYDEGTERFTDIFLQGACLPVEL